ncbi:hypothetical protein ABIB82_007850 [Bradyrhizobium sp. i1.8.4]
MHAAVSEELRRRGVIRSSNNPVGDLAEHLFCRAFGWKQAPNSMRDADATDGAEVRYQIKGRRLTSHNRSRQLGALRDLPAQGFDVQGHGPQGAQRQLAALPRALHAQRAGACRQERAACRLRLHRHRVCPGRCRGRTSPVAEGRRPTPPHRESSPRACAGSSSHRSSVVPRLRWRVATRSYRRIAGDHRKAARPLRRYLRRASGRLCSTELHHHRGHDPASSSLKLRIQLVPKPLSKSNLRSNEGLNCIA